MSYTPPLQECKELYLLEGPPPFCHHVHQLLVSCRERCDRGRERKVGSSELLKDGSVVGGCERKIVKCRFQSINWCWNDRESSAKRLTPTQGQDLTLTIDMG